MKHRGSFPHRMDAPDRHNGQRDERTNGQTDEETRLHVLYRIPKFINLTISGFSLTIKLSAKKSVRDRKVQIPLSSSRLDTFDVSSPCILAVSSLSNTTARHDSLDSLDTLGSLHTTSATGATRNLVVV